jgi:hypothetical protein
MTQPEKHEVNSLSSRLRHVYWVEATKPRFRKGRLPLWVRCGLLSLSLASLASSRLLILQTYLCYAKAS